MRSLALALALLACGGRAEPGVDPGRPVVEPPAPRVSAPPDDALIEAIARPPMLDAAGASALREAVLAELALGSVPSAPAVGAMRPALAERSSADAATRQQLYAMLSHQLIAGAPHRKGQTSERLIRVEPALVFAPDGTATLTFETLRPVPGANVTFGHRMPEDPLGLARLRRRSSALEDRADVPGGHRYRLRLDAKGVLRPHYDVARILQTKRGVLVWRLEVLDALVGTSRVLDGETAFRCDPCQGPAASFVQLPSLRLGPFVDQVGRSSAIVSFDTDAATAAWVAFFPEGREAKVVASAAPGTHHEIALEGLEAGTRYRYQPVVVDRRGEAHVHRGGTFETEPEALTRFEIVALSDSRSGLGAADAMYGGTNARVLRGLLETALARGRPRAIVFVGDLVDGYTTWPRSLAFELEMWKRAVQPVHAHVPLYELMGNHESLLDLWLEGWAADRAEPSAEDVFASQFVNPEGGPEAAEGAPTYRENTYAVDVGTAHLAMLNSNYDYRSHPGREDHPAGPGGNREGWVDDRTLAWLDADLGAARAAGQKHLFVFAHEPGFPNGGHVRDGLYWNGDPVVLAQRAKLFAILGRHGVAAIVHGDEHNYSRVLVDEATLGAPIERPVWHLVSGGAGAPYYAQDARVPWAERVAAFDARQHFLRLLIDGDECAIQAVSREGAVIDRFDVAEH
ncbi:MAG: metallophosphoesterase family protein [Myxococcota bacterium]